MPDFFIRAGATRPSLIDTLYAHGTPLDLTGATVTFIGKKYGAAAFSSTAVLQDAVNGVVRWDPIAADTTTQGSGTYEAQWQIVWPSSGGTQYVPSHPIVIEVNP